LNISPVKEWESITHLALNIAWYSWVQTFDDSLIISGRDARGLSWNCGIFYQLNI
jgi:hypothetical protein